MNPKVSIIVPWRFMPNWQQYLDRCLESIEMQTFTDYEVILLKYGRAAETQNKLIQMAQGEYIKILHMDDFFTYPASLETIINSFPAESSWLASDCYHAREFGSASLESLHSARYSEDIHIGNNTIGAPSVVTFRNGLGVTFDEDLDWLYDVSLYKKLNDLHGAPHILHSPVVTIGLHPGQLTHQIPDSLKLAEIELMGKRYE